MDRKHRIGGTASDKAYFQRCFWISLLALGTSSVCVQLVVIREIMSGLSGNELVIGLVLGIWLLLTAAGSALGVWLAQKNRPRSLLFWGHILIAFVPFLQITAIRALPLFWVRGEMPGLAPAIIASTLIALPFCLTGGGMIPIAGALLKGKETARRVFVADTLGDIIGGLLFSFIFVALFSHWDSLLMVGLLNLFAAGVFVPRASVFLLLLAGGLCTGRVFDFQTLHWRFPGQTVLLHKNSPFAQLTISKAGEQLNLFQDATLLFSTNDLSVEAKAHLPMSQVPQNADVLLISGGIFGTIREIAKHTPRRIDYVELDPAIVQLDDKIGRIRALPFVHVHIGDGRLFVKQSEKRYHAVIVDLPGPANAQLNRFYSRGFFREVQSILHPGGVLCFSLVGAENYLEEKGLAVNRSVHAALQAVFPNVLVLPGTTHYYLASQGPLTANIASTLTARSIVTRQLVDYDLPTLSDPLRIDWLKQVLDEERLPPNEDLSPRAFGDFMDLWLKKSGSSKTLVFLVMFLSVAFAGWACRRDRVQFTVMTSGMSAMALELSLLLLFQVIYGYVYLRMCLFITLFMIGSALGAMLAEKTTLPPRAALIGTDIALVAVSLGGLLVSLAGVGFRTPAALFLLQALVIPGFVFISAFTVGFQFSNASYATAGSGPQVVGRLYLADLAGAACGTILTGLVFIPKIGIIGTFALAAVVKTISTGVNLFKKPIPM